MFPGNRGESTGGAGRCSMRPLPRHITALYLAMVLSFMIMFHIALVGADVLVYSQRTGRPVEGMEFEDAPARFGGRIPAEGIKGLLSYSHPAEACSPIEKPPPSKSYTGKWIVLIRRCNCTFEDKVRNAEKAGYAAAIIHNVNSSDLEPMSANGPTNITIPSVFVGEDTGIIISERFQWDEGYYIVINDSIPFNINTHLLIPFVIVLGICFLIMMSFMIVKCIKDRMQARRHRLPSSALRKIPTTRYKSKDPYETCAICLEDYLEGDKLRILPCSHAFHCKCIDPWLTCSRRECPMCKRKVFAHNERIPSDEEENDDRGDDEVPAYRRVFHSDDSDDEAAPLMQTRGRQTQGRRDNPSSGGTFQTQRENPFRRAAMRLRGSLSPAVAPPAPPTNVDDDTSSTTSLTSSGSFNSLPSDSNQQSEAAQDSIPATTVVIPADSNPSPARMSVNSNPADIQDVSTAPHNAETNEEGRHGDLVV